MRTTRANHRGMTLVLALFVIVIITVLIVALLVQSQSAMRGSDLHLDAVKARQLAESARSIVSARIQEATTTQNGQTWASQPGAIRVYGSDGNLDEIFKLYSSETPTSIDPAELSADFPPTDWAAQPNIFVDLNAPLRRGNTLTFPIVDPRLFSGDSTADPQGFSYTNSLSGAVLPQDGAADDQRLPMPVRWLYVLSDGSLASPESGPGDVVTVPGAGPNAEIVGRIAFWTDDETSKINVNTAAGGEFWDTPRINSDFELNLANSQPVQGEFQRYPGHPATVDLRSVFPGLSLEELYEFAPKIQTGGSKGGTVETSANSKPAPIVPDSDRLFVSTGEIGFKQDRSEFVASGIFGSFSERAERAGFLLTANSRAPELNQFGRPRVAIWPISSNTSDRSSLDKLIAYCATIRVNGSTPRHYFFQRRNASSPTEDYTNIQENKDLLAYLRKATSEAVPGFGGNFRTKYGGPVRDQILTEIFDYIRGATNLKDPLGKKFADPVPPTVLEAGEGQVAPIRIDDWGTGGFGRFLTVGEAFFWFTWQGQGENTSTPAVDRDPAVAPALPLPASPPADDTVQVQAIFALQFMGAAAGYSEYTPNITVKIEGLDQFTLTSGNNTVNMGFPASGTVPLDQVKDVPIGAIEDFRCMVRNKVFSRDEAASNRFPFYSDIIEIPRTGPVAMAGNGSPVTISIYAGPSAVASALIQKITLQVPNANISAPQKPTTGTNGTPRLWGTGSAYGADRFTQGTRRDRGSAYMNVNDRTRSMVSATGDHRLTAATADVPSSFFLAHKGSTGTNANTWTTPGVRHASGLLSALGYTGYGPRDIVSDPLLTGSLISGVSYNSGSTVAGISRPPVATHVLGKPAGALSWDWDTGIGARADGPWINKPDEGSLGSTDAGKGSYFGGAETGQLALDQTMFLPNRQLPSPGMFGSLPTGINPQNPAASTAWQTLLLRPDPTGLHPGNAGRARDGTSQPGAPADHLLLDLFWMPVVEPYAVSEPFSTAGKVNMNSRLIPFTHITRETALYAAMEGERLLALQPTDIATVPSSGSAKHYNSTSSIIRSELNVDETLKGFRQRFDANGIFISPTEISSIHLVPKGQTYAGAPAFWQGATATGDNVREKPYANLLAKFTTKSNTYSIHVIAQSLKKSKGPNSNAGVFGESGDRVVAEWKGSFLVERFLDPNDSRLPDFAGTVALSDWNNPAYNANRYYQTRVLQVKEWR